MNLLLFQAPNNAPQGQVPLTARQIQHCREVLKLTPGQQLRVGAINGKLGSGEVHDLSGASPTLHYQLQELPPTKLPLTLVLALPRPKMLRRILRTVAELGVAELHLMHSQRVEKSYWQTPALAADKVRSYFLEGLEQARDTVVPQCTLHRRFKPFVQDLLPTLQGIDNGLLAQPGTHPLCPRKLEAHSLVVVGPEGGFIPYEVELLQTAGLRPVSLGPRILRVETAVTTLLGRLA